MTDVPRPADDDGLVYMVTGMDKNGDTHIFVTSDLRRAENAVVKSWSK